MKILVRLSGILILLLLVFLLYEPVLLNIGNFLVVKDNPLQPADMIHVLAGSPSRIDYGIQLYQQGYGRQLFFTGRKPTQEASQGSARLAAQRAFTQGVPVAAVISAKAIATNTYEEALALKQWVAGYKQRPTIIIVSSPYHMRRVAYIFSLVLGDAVNLEFAPVPFELADGSNKQKWWTNKWARHMVASEYLKNLYYYLKYGQ